MSIVNFSIEPSLLKRIERYIKKKGFSSKAEFFRYLAHVHFENITMDFEEDEPSDELIQSIRIAEKEKKQGKLKTYNSAEELFRSWDK